MAAAYIDINFLIPSSQLWSMFFGSLLQWYLRDGGSLVDQLYLALEVYPESQF